eukprot:9489104-Pyramimonas_sp.AAC.1
MKGIKAHEARNYPCANYGLRSETWSDTGRVCTANGCAKHVVRRNEISAEVNMLRGYEEASSPRAPRRVKPRPTCRVLADASPDKIHIPFSTRVNMLHPKCTKCYIVR